jgi:hypothetical protein
LHDDFPRAGQANVANDVVDQIRANVTMVPLKPENPALLDNKRAHYVQLGPDHSGVFLVKPGKGAKIENESEGAPQGLHLHLAQDRICGVSHWLKPQ